MDLVKQKGFAPILIIIVLATVVLGGGYFVYQRYQPTSPSSPYTPPQKTACTLEAKLCPDGTSVGRTGPNCEFSPCPTPEESTSSAETANWKTYTNKEYEYSVQYPSNWKVVEAKPRIGNKPEWAGDILIQEENEVQKVTFFEQNYETYPGKFEIRVLSNPSNLTLEQWSRNYDKIYKLLTLVGETTLGNQTAKQFSIFSYEVPGNSAIASINNQNIYYISFADWDKYNDPNIAVQIGTENHPKIYDQILSTFRFLP